MADQIFEKLYKNLNTKQREAVDTIDGPVMVIAGPGTGKTTILTLRIANILRETDTAPESILALTFTESGVAAMRRKLVSIMGPVGYRVNVYTFHSFCNEVIKENPQSFPRIIGGEPITDVDRVVMMEEIISIASLENLKPYGDPLFYVRPVLSSIQQLKREDISVDEFRKRVSEQEEIFLGTDDLYNTSGKYEGQMKGKYTREQKKIENNKELVDLYEAYQNELAKRHQYDYEDMIMEVVRMLKQEKELLLELQETYQYVLADEHQDSNQAQNHILELLSGFFDEPNLFIVGDEKQAIFRFQGASLENFLYFKKRFPTAQMISLVDNYRSTQTILDGAHSLIGNASGSEEIERVELKSQLRAPSSKLIRRAETANKNAEAILVATEINKLLKNNVEPEDIAVLYRSNKDALWLVPILREEEIVTHVRGDNDLFTDQTVRRLLILLRAVNSYGDDEILTEALFLDTIGLSHLDVYKLLQQARSEHISVYEALIASTNSSVKEFSDRMGEWSTFAKNESVLETIDQIFSESGLREHLVNRDDYVAGTKTVRAFLDHVRDSTQSKQFATLSDYMNHLQALEDHNIRITNRESNSVSGKVNLMTTHKSKGLEFEHVFIVDATEKSWEKKTHRNYFNLPIYDEGNDDHFVDDERRLFYVALTRAKQQVTISGARANSEGRELIPSQFISEIDESHVEQLDTKDIDEMEDKKPVATYVTSPIDTDEKDYLVSLFREQGLSVTALNNYLRCPWQYFFTNLIRIPHSPVKHQLYGTAIHESLKDFFDAYASKKDMSKSDLSERFKEYIGKKPLSAQDLSASEKKGIIALEGFYDTYKDTWHRKLKNEFGIRGVHLSIGDEEILLKGNLDKVEIGEGSEVNVIDYKTGKVKSRNDIEGETKSSNGDIKRQLVFYKLLLKLYNDGEYTMRTGEIDFIEPDAKGKHHKEKFEISDTDVDELKDQISKVSEEIIGMSFWDSQCEKNDCEYCELAENVKK
ncbi:hypothetical protein COB55_04180 [Candidatus Wolfebacteria bacterium]|nr:MAG: hypothetical protein COB55_04180 [Candidatus Wolfebacteria bacterium]